jgi:hypothetical protein
MNEAFRQLAIEQWKTDVEFWKMKAHSAHHANDWEGAKKAIQAHSTAINNQVRACSNK